MRCLRTLLALAVAALDASAQPGPDTVPARLFREDAAVATEPLDFGGLAAVRRAALSTDGLTWTGTAHRLEGVDVSDPHRPGLALLAGDAVLVREVRLEPELSVYGAAVATRAYLPEAAWHGEISTSATASPLASGNLPPEPERGSVRQAERFRWFTWNALRAAGPLSRRLSTALTAAGRWSSQTVAEAAAGQDVFSRLVSAAARLVLNTGRDHRADLLVLGERPHVSGWALTDAAESLAARRHAPPIRLWPDLKEDRRLDLVQAGWRRQGLNLRYGFARAELATAAAGRADRGAIPRWELTTGALDGPAPLETRGTRRRHNFAGGYDARPARGHHLRASFVAGSAGIENRYGGPPLHVITAQGAPAFVVEWSAPARARSRIRSAAVGIQDRVQLARGVLAVEAGLLLDASRGSAAGRRAISWTHLFRSAGVALTPPGLRWLTLRGGYARRYQALAGRYLEFANPGAIGGLEYRWVDRNRDGRFQPEERGELLRRFGAPYWTVSPLLRRPLVDEFTVEAGVSPAGGLTARLRLFRRDEKDGVAALNLGVPFAAYRGRAVVDPGPDFVAGTFDDALLVVWDQDPATFGQDRFELGNPGLRTMNKGLVAELSGRSARLDWRASFLAVKTFGPAGPGNEYWENDSGVVSALFQDPNTLLHATGRNFFDRAFAGRLAARWEGPAGIEAAGVVTYLDGLAFGRRLLVPDLAQGPLVVMATPRGSPEGGHRTQFLLNWDLRLSRVFPARRASLRLTADVFNVLNRAGRLREDDLSGPRFNARLPAALQPPRFLRLGLSVSW